MIRDSLRAYLHPFYKKGYVDGHTDNITKERNLLEDYLVDLENQLRSTGVCRCVRDNNDYEYTTLISQISPITTCRTCKGVVMEYMYIPDR